MNQYLENKHQSVPANYYDNGIKKNLFQKFWHNRRFSEANKLLTDITAKDILDVGCHGGKFTSIILSQFPKANIIGIDISSEAIASAKNKYPNINFLIAWAEKLPFDDSKFDLVTCFEVLEHLEKPQQSISEIKRILKKNGSLLTLVPTENLLFRIIWYFWSKAGPGKVWEHTHVQKFSGRSLDSLLKSAGLKIIKRKTFLLGMLLLIQTRKE